MSTKTLMTAEELERMPDDDSVRTELDEGELITMPPAGGEHSNFGVEIGSLLNSFVKRHRLGKVYGADGGFRLKPDTVRVPDVSFVRAKRISDVHRKGFMNGAPDLAIEIFSPSDSVRQLMRKTKQYFAAGCHTVWIVYPDQREVNVLEATGTDRLLTAEDTMKVAELLGD